MITTRDLRQVAATIVLLAGCGGGSGSTSDAGRSLATATEFCVEWAKVIAQSDARCLGGRIDDVLPRRLEFCQTMQAALVAKGTIVYHADKAAACLTQFEAASATDCWSDASCAHDVLVGQVVEGAPCTDGDECANGLLCARANLASCGAPTCRRLAREGEGCETVWCADGLSCAGSICEKTLLAVGDACDPSMDRCAAGSWCAAGPGDTHGTCRDAQVGSPCDDDFDCGYENFCAGTVCERRRALGGPCADYDQACGLLAQCDPSTKVCVSAGARDGQPCGTLGFCLRGSCNVGDTADGASVCRSEQPQGAACQSPYECASGNCVDGICAACIP